MNPFRCLLLCAALALAALVPVVEDGAVRADASPPQCPDPPQRPRVRPGFVPPAGACVCAGGCACLVGECGAAGCPAAGQVQRRALPFAAARLAAIEENKPLLIWVGQSRPVIEALWPQYVHTEEGTYPRAYNPGVVVGKPDGLGGLDRAGDLPGLPSRQQVQSVVDGYTPPAPLWQQGTTATWLGFPPRLMPGPSWGGGCPGGRCR